jgi:hypothetical protein
VDVAANNQRRRLAAMHRQAQVDLSLRRLSRLTALEREYGQQLNDAGRRLLRASTFTVYCDCRALGLEERARLILGELRAARLPAPAAPKLAATATA